MTIRRVFRKIHRWVGLLAALWLMVLAGSGYLLQHSEDLGLDQAYTSNSWLLEAHGYGKLLNAWDASGQNLTLMQIDDSLIQRQILTPMPAEIKSAIWIKDVWVIASQNSLFWVNVSGDVIQELDGFDGLPTPVQGLAKLGEQIVIKSEEQFYIMDVLTGFSRLSEKISIKELQARELTKEERETGFELALSHKLSWEKVLFGWHSGVKGIPWLNDLSAFALIFLAMSGIFIFFKKKRNGRQVLRYTSLKKRG